MSYYFDLFPKVQYSIKGKKPLISPKDFQTLTNVMKRFILKYKLDPKIAIYYEYSVEDGEKPWHVAYKFYEDARLDWVILLTNNIIDPYFDWHLSYHEFEEYLRGKYGSPEAARAQIHHYEKIISPKFVPNSSANDDREAIPETKVIVDETTYNNTPAADRRIVYSYDYEFNINESRRNIKVLDYQYVDQIIEEAEVILENG